MRPFLRTLARERATTAALATGPGIGLAGDEPPDVLVLVPVVEPVVVLVSAEDPLAEEPPPDGGDGGEGGVEPTTVIGRVMLAVLPPTSLIVSVTLYVPPD